MAFLQHRRLEDPRDFAHYDLFVLYTVRYNGSNNYGRWLFQGKVQCGRSDGAQ